MRIHGGDSAMEKDYFVPFLDYGEDKFEEKRSKFTGRLWHVETPEQATAKIKEMRDSYWDATHHCYAYILREGNIMRYSDDGEPQGTAGVPMLECVEKEGLVDVAVVVTRYFGGILLGAGGLVRAYSHGAKIAVDAAQRKLMTTCVVLSMELDYSFYGKLTYILPNYTCRVEDTDFGAVVKMRVLFKKDEADAFIKEVTEMSAALIVPQQVEERFDHFAQ